jgi:hypothetical protein
VSVAEGDIGDFDGIFTCWIHYGAPWTAVVVLTRNKSNFIF